MDLVNLELYKEWNDGFVGAQTIIDKFTNWPWILPIFSKEASEITENFLQEVVSNFGTPQILHTDNGGEFICILENKRLINLGSKEI